MTWSMPPKTLKIVAALLAALSLGAFGLGVANAPHRGRLPGEHAAGGNAAGALINATEATPLSEDRIEGAPPPRELTDEEKAKLEAEREARAEAEAAAKLVEAEGQPPKVTPPAATAQDRVGDLLDSVTPPPSDDPPH